MNKKAVCLGEMLIDFVSTESGVTLKDAPGFKKVPGGAPANTAVGLAKLGIISSFVGKVGIDAFGEFLRETLQKYGVNTAWFTGTNKAKTTLAFVSLTEEGERDFVFYRDPGADMLLDQGDIQDECFTDCGVFHFGSITMTHEPAYSATLKAISTAKKYGCLVSFDPNIRLSLWKSTEEAREKIRRGMSQCDVLKVNEEEACLIAAAPGFAQAVEYILSEYDLGLLAITRGKEGCILVQNGNRVEERGFRVASVDTTGAGDGFTAGLLSALYMFWKDIRDRQPIPLDTLRYSARYANAAGALTTLKKGAIPALPGADEVEGFLKANQH